MCGRMTKGITYVWFQWVWGAHKSPSAENMAQHFNERFVDRNRFGGENGTLVNLNKFLFRIE